MGVLTTDMQRIVREQRIGFVATIAANGTPDLAPAGTMTVWDGDHLVFMEDLFSRRTVANLLRNPAIELTIVDPITYRAYRFAGRAAILNRGPLFDRIVAFFRERYGAAGAVARTKRVGLVEVQRAAPLAWPVYDAGASTGAGTRYVEYHGRARRRVASGGAERPRRHRA